MKRTPLPSRILTAVAVAAFLSIAVPAYAADFFPLDVWQEMQAWEQANGAEDEKLMPAYRQPIPVDGDTGEGVHLSFPFDVWAALNALGGIDGDNMKAFSVSYDSPERNKTNPYWYPEEY
jgi:hypothetical protein